MQAVEDVQTLYIIIRKLYTNTQNFFGSFYHITFILVGVTASHCPGQGWVLSFVLIALDTPVPDNQL